MNNWYDDISVFFPKDGRVYFRLIVLQLGVIKCLHNTLNAFSPIQFIEIWSEFNILDMCLELMISNYTTGTDLSCQCDMLIISVNLLAGT